LIRLAHRLKTATPEESVSKLPVVLGLIGLGLGSWYFLSHYRIQGIDALRIERRDAAPADPRKSPARKLAKNTIRIAAVNFGPLDANRLAKPGVGPRVVHILRQFDVVALQDIQAPDQGLLVRLMEEVNAQGRRYHYAVPPAVGRDVVRQYNAFVFDTQTVQIDWTTVASVDNRDGRFRHPPLVAAFQARGPEPEEAFTFTLVNVHTPLDRVEAELELLAAVYRAVRDSGRNEDDVILLGQIGADDEHLGPLARVANLTCAVWGVPSTTRGTRLVDNLLFDRRATIEFTRRAGVLDIMREFNLSPREAAETSEHLPVWAEFSVYEGGQIAP